MNFWVEVQTEAFSLAHTSTHVPTRRGQVSMDRHRYNLYTQNLNSTPDVMIDFMTLSNKV